MFRLLLDRLPNLTPLLLVLGLAAIVMSLMAPILSGNRVARSERRADAFAEAVLVGGLAAKPIAFDKQEDVDRFVEAVRAACEQLGVPKSTFPKLEAGPLNPKGVYLSSKHYRFLLTRRPPPIERKATYDAKDFELLEAYGWPSRPTSPGRTVFYHGEGDRSCFTRNLVSKYVGETRVPKGGHAREMSRFDDLREKHHRGAKDERWLHSPVGIRVNRIAAALMRVAGELRSLEALDRELGETLTKALSLNLSEVGIWRLYHPEFVPDETGTDRLVWEDRQYAYCLLRGVVEGVASVEVYGWPREDLHPAGLVIFYPSKGDPAVAENNEPELFGREQVPAFGDGDWRKDPESGAQTSRNRFYLGGRGRWIRFPDFTVRHLVDER